MAILYDTAAVLSKVDTTRAADVFRLAQCGDAKCMLLWRDLELSNPPLARLAVAYANKCSRESRKASVVVDDIIVKGKRVRMKCGCGKSVKRSRRHCPKCGAENPHFLAKVPKSADAPVTAVKSAKGTGFGLSPGSWPRCVRRSRVVSGGRVDCAGRAPAVIFR